MQENTEICAGSISLRKNLKIVKVAPGKSAGEYKFRPRKIRQGSKVPRRTTAPPAPGKTSGNAPRTPGRPPDARTPPGQQGPGPRCRPCPSSAALRPGSHHARTGPRPRRSAKDARKDAQRPTVAPDQLRPRWTGRNAPGAAPAPWRSARPRGSSTSGPRRPQEARRPCPDKLPPPAAKAPPRPSRAAQDAENDIHI